MAPRNLLVILLAGLGLGLACGGSNDDSNGGDASAGKGGKGGGAADSGTSGGTNAGGSSGVGATGTGATGTGATGTGATGTGATGSGATGTGATGTGATGSGGTGACGLTQCSDCVDNDGDGFVDMADPECIAPADNDEATFATGIPGDNVDACKQDCFFDGNSGQGDDGCEWQLKCDPASPGAPKCPYDPTYKNCPAKQSQQCIDFCTKLTPNGCDCFGCCTVPLPGGGTKNILLLPTCTLADVNDPVKCPTCTPTGGCQNTCEHCELCLGKTELPPDCTTSTGGAGGTGGVGTGGTPSGGSGGTPSGGGTGGSCVAPLCKPGQQSCGVSCLPPCATGTYCLTGCCISIG